jgi:hypothetical protein
MKGGLAGSTDGVGFGKVGGGTMEASGAHGGGQSEIGTSIGTFEMNFEVVDPGFVRLRLGLPFTAGCIEVAGHIDQIIGEPHDLQFG